MGCRGIGSADNPHRINGVIRADDRTSKFLRRLRICWLILAALALTATPVEAADQSSSAAESASEPTLSKSSLTTQLEKLQAHAELDADEKKDAVELLKTALDDWDAGVTAEQRKLRLQRQLETAVRELDSLRQRLAALPEKSAFVAPENADAEQLARRRDELEQRLDNSDNGLRERVVRLGRDLEERNSRLESLGTDLLDAEEKLQAVETERDKLSDEEDSPVTAAHQLALQTALHRWQQEVSALKAEESWLQSTDADRWIRVHQELAEREIALIEAELQQVGEHLDQQRRREATDRVERARQEFEAMPPGLQTWAKENHEFAERSRKLTERLEELDDEHDEAKEDFESLHEESQEIRKIADSVGRNDALGMMLRQQLARIPDRKSLARSIAAREDETRDIKLKLFEIDRQQRQTPELEVVFATAKAFAESTHDGFDETTLRSQIERVLERREELLDQLDDDYKSLRNQLLDLDRTERKLLTLSEQTAEFCATQRLWLRSSGVWGLRELLRWRESTDWLSESAAWQEVPVALLLDLERRPLLYLLCGFAVCGGLLLRERQSRKSVAESPAAEAEFSISAAASTAAMTVARAGLLPGLMAFTAWRLEQAAVDSDWSQAVAHGLWRCVAVTWPLLIVRRSCVSRGLGEAHLGWPRDVARRISHRVTIFLPICLLLLFVVGTTESLDHDVVSDSLGRTAFLALMLVGGFFCHSLIHAAATAPQVTSVTPQHRQRWATWLGWLVPLIPWGLAGVAFVGYYDTALRLAWRLEGTGWLWLIIAGLHSVGLRWIVGEQHRLETITDAARSATSPPTLDRHQSLFARLRNSHSTRSMSPGEMTRQMATLLNTVLLVAGICGLTAIWRDVLPAGLLDRGLLWQTAVTHQVMESTDSGGSAVRTITRLEPVTILNFGLAILICGVTFVAARNLPGLVEVLFLERLPLDAGGRFAVTILLRYAMFVVGVSLACARVHIGWSNIQWLVAAASVGLGFGLQEIFANFVSGIILLFERPIRVGDVITIGDTTGTVSQIRFRSTTIRDADRRELVVPNKDLITGKLLNWTLSDQTNRIRIRIAVGYDADPNRVRQLLYEIATEHPSVLKEPPPTAAFEEFGANTLIFNLSAFLPSLDQRQKVTHELHAAIHSRLHADGIAMPTPQPATPPKSPPKGVAA